MLVEFPELKNDEIALNQIDIEFISNQLFEEYKKLGNMGKKIEILGSYTGIQKSDGTPYFHIDYLIDHVLRLSAEEKEENRRYWIKDAAAGAGSSEETPSETPTETPEETPTETPETPSPEAGTEGGGEEGKEGGEFEF
jgi:hypothetical protein